MGRKVVLKKSGAAKSKSPPGKTEEKGQKPLSSIWGEVENSINFSSPEISRLELSKLAPVLSPIRDDTHFPPLEKSKNSEILSSTQIMSPIISPDKKVTSQQKNSPVREAEPGGKGDEGDLSLPVATESRLLPSETSMIDVDELHGPEKSGSLDTADISIIEDTGEGKFFDWYRHTSN